jgi:Rhodanese-like domain
MPRYPGLRPTAEVGHAAYDGVVARGEIHEGAAVPTVAIGDVQSHVGDDRVIILDVLPREAYASGHLPGAINIPLAELEDRAQRDLPDRTRDIIVYCGGPT